MAWMKLPARAFMYAQMCLEGHGCLLSRLDLSLLKVHEKSAFFLILEHRKYWSVPIDKSKLKNDFFYSETDQEERLWGVSA